MGSGPGEIPKPLRSVKGLPARTGATPPAAVMPASGGLAPPRPDPQSPPRVVRHLRRRARSGTSSSSSRSRGASRSRSRSWACSPSSRSASRARWTPTRGLRRRGRPGLPGRSDVADPRLRRGDVRDPAILGAVEQVSAVVSAMAMAAAVQRQASGLEELYQGGARSPGSAPTGAPDRGTRRLSNPSSRCGPRASAGRR